MRSHLLLLLAVLLCAGCVQRREVSPRVKLRPAQAKDLALHLDVDRGERIFKVTLEYRGSETVSEDYLRPRFRLFCVGSDTEVQAFECYGDAPGLYLIPEVEPGTTVAYRIPFEMFGFPHADRAIKDCQLFILYRSGHKVVHSNSLRIEEPLSLAPGRIGNTEVYRAMDLRLVPFSDLRGRKDSMPN